MSSEWTNFGRDLMVSLTDVPRGQWTTHLCGQLRGAVRNGALRPGVLLPSTRVLAADLRLSRGLVVNVYEQLVAEGYLESRPGSATLVSSMASRPATANNTQQKVASQVVRHNPGLPDLGLFPRTEWLKAYKTALGNLPDRDLHYGDPQGYEPLRYQLADYLGRVRGSTATPDQILIVNGYAQALAILATVLPRVGIDTVAVEEPGSNGTRGQLQYWGISTPPATVDNHGLRVDALESTGARAVLVTPAHHYPTGVVLSPDRRRQLLAWVDAGPRYVIEDDYDAEFRYDHAPVGSLQPLAPERIITGSSVSKTLAPGLRLGWLVLPTALVRDAVDTKAASDLAGPTLPQAALAHFLSSGAFDRHLRRSRRRYRQRRQELADRLEPHLPPDAITGLDAGLNLCIRLPRHLDDRKVAEQLRSRGVNCQALSYYHQTAPTQGGIILDLATTTDTHLDHVIASTGTEAT